MTESEIIKTFNKLNNKLNNSITKAREAFSDFRKLVGDICTHPESHCRTYHKNCDNGYGLWWKSYYTVCTICGKRKNEHSVNWYKEQ
jgi:hypothetical protein